MFTRTLAKNLVSVAGRGSIRHLNLVGIAIRLGHLVGSCGVGDNPRDRSQVRDRDLGVAKPTPVRLGSTVSSWE
jgi:hypothetical protein